MKAEYDLACLMSGQACECDCKMGVRDGNATSLIVDMTVRWDMKEECDMLDEGHGCEMGHERRMRHP